MLYIKKGKEPRSLTEYKKQAGAYYEGYPDKIDVKNALLAEQGFLCAYCMRRIGVHSMKIEHWAAQNPIEGYGEDTSLSYHNMLGVCMGKEGERPSKQTCDTHKGNKALTIDPRRQEHIDSIFYDHNGTIGSTDARLHNDIDTILNLNGEGTDLKENRKAVLNALNAYLKKQQAQGIWKRDLLLKARRLFGSYEDGKLKPYVGIALYFIDRKYLPKSR